MYKSNPLQFYNFSTMTTDGTHWHEVGHAFGLDDEYGKHSKKAGYKKNGCRYSKYGKYTPLTYQMCDGGVSEQQALRLSLYRGIALRVEVAPMGWRRAGPPAQVV